MEVIDTSSGEVLVSRPAMESSFAGDPSISQDGSRVSFVGPSGDIEIIDVGSGNHKVLPDSAGTSWAQALSPDGSLLASSSFDGSIAVWDVDSDDVVGSLQGHGDRTPVNLSEPQFIGRVDELAFRPDGSELASVGYDGTVRVWDPATGEGRVLAGFDYEVISLVYSTDGARLAVAERTGVIHVLDSETGEELLAPDAVSGPPVSLAFSPDGGHLAGAGPGPIAHVWEMGSGRLVRRLQGSTYAPRGVAFVNEGTELLVLADEGVLRHYLLDPLDMVELARDRVTRDLTEEECQRYLQRTCDP